MYKNKEGMKKHPRPTLLRIMVRKGGKEGYTTLVTKMCRATDVV